MNGIAVSLYDKFEDLAVLIDIVRHNWEEDYYIAVCCNHPDAESRLEQLDYDELVLGAEIELHDGEWGPKGVSRVMDSFRKACFAGLEHTDYLMHLHADAWPLSEERYEALIERLEAREKSIAVRGLGPEYRLPGYWLGHAMDQFILFDSSFAAESGFFDYNPFDLLPHTSVHTALMLRLLGAAGLSEVHFYSDMSDDEYWDGRPVERFSQPWVRPSVFVPEWDFLHVAPDEFPGDLGKSVQAMYLQRHGITDGEHVQAHIDRYGLAEQELLDRLATIERRQDRQIRRIGIDPVSFGRQFGKKAEHVDVGPAMKVRRLLGNVLKKTTHYAHNIVDTVLPGREPAYSWGPLIGPEARVNAFYPDRRYPESLADHYRRQVDHDDVPAEYSDFWFEGEDV